jgi:hypothetical protein
VCEVGLPEALAVIHPTIALRASLSGSVGSLLVDESEYD